MERYTMFLDWKNQYCENDYTTQSNLQIQCNPSQITNGIFTELEQIILKKNFFLMCSESKFFFNLFNLFIYLFGCVGSSFLCEGFL